MAHYMIQVSFTGEMMERMVETPELFDGSWLRDVVGRLDGSVVGMWACFGEYDAIVICELPDKTDLFALTSAFRAIAPLSKANTTFLLTQDEQLAGFKKARGQG